jgi:hypothetical protein
MSIAGERQTSGYDCGGATALLCRIQALAVHTNAQDGSGLRARAGLFDVLFLPLGRGVRASALSRRPDHPFVSRPGTVSLSIARLAPRSARRRSAGGNLPLRQRVAFHFRLSANFVRCRHKPFGIGQQSYQDRADPSKSHQSSPFVSTGYVPLRSQSGARIAGKAFQGSK